MADRQPYIPPTLTRVVLQPTQAVLSVCSTDATTNTSSGVPTFCSPPSGQNCKKKALPATGDSGAQS